jgi:hypothetical protein
MNLLDHGAADTLGSIGAIRSAPLSREHQSHIGVPRSTATGSPKGSADAARQRRRCGIRQLLANGMAFILPL